MQNTTPFNTGRLDIQVQSLKTMDARAAVPLADWDDGFLAFAASEAGLAAFSSPEATLLWNTPNPYQQEGWLMEANLWRARGGVLEEICLEREDDGLLLQSWKLFLNAPEKPADHDICYYRPVSIPLREPLRQRPKLWETGTLNCMEVIYPAARLHIFLSIGGSHAVQV